MVLPAALICGVGGSLEEERRVQFLHQVLFKLPVRSRMPAINILYNLLMFG